MVSEMGRVTYNCRTAQGDWCGEGRGVDSQLWRTNGLPAIQFSYKNNLNTHEDLWPWILSSSEG